MRRTGSIQEKGLSASGHQCRDVKFFLEIRDSGLPEIIYPALPQQVVWEHVNMYVPSDLVWNKL